MLFGSTFHRFFGHFWKLPVWFLQTLLFCDPLFCFCAQPVGPTLFFTPLLSSSPSTLFRLAIFLSLCSTSWVLSLAMSYLLVNPSTAFYFILFSALPVFALGLLHERFLPTACSCLGLGSSLKYWVLLNWLVKISYRFSGFVPGPCWATVYPVGSSFGSGTNPKVVLLWIRVRDYLVCLVTCNMSEHPLLKS